MKVESNIPAESHGKAVEIAKSFHSGSQILDKADLKERDPIIHQVFDFLALRDDQRLLVRVLPETYSPRNEHSVPLLEEAAKNNGYLVAFYRHEMFKPGTAKRLHEHLFGSNALVNTVGTLVTIFVAAIAIYKFVYEPVPVVKLAHLPLPTPVSDVAGEEASSRQERRPPLPPALYLSNAASAQPDVSTFAREIAALPEQRRASALHDKLASLPRSTVLSIDGALTLLEGLSEGPVRQGMIRTIIPYMHFPLPASDAAALLHSLPTALYIATLQDIAPCLAPVTDEQKGELAESAEKPVQQEVYFILSNSRSQKCDLIR